MDVQLNRALNSSGQTVIVKCQPTSCGFESEMTFTFHLFSNFWAWGNVLTTTLEKHDKIRYPGSVMLNFTIERNSLSKKLHFGLRQTKLRGAYLDLFPSSIMLQISEKFCTASLDKYSKYGPRRGCSRTYNKQQEQ